MGTVTGSRAAVHRAMGHDLIPILRCDWCPRRLYGCRPLWIVVRMYGGYLGHHGGYFGYVALTAFALGRGYEQVLCW